jgi:hypothetical protein
LGGSINSPRTVDKQEKGRESACNKRKEEKGRERKRKEEKAHVCGLQKDEEKCSLDHFNERRDEPPNAMLHPLQLSVNFRSAANDQAKNCIFIWRMLLLAVVLIG